MVNGTAPILCGVVARLAARPTPSIPPVSIIRPIAAGGSRIKMICSIVEFTASREKKSQDLLRLGTTDG